MGQHGVGALARWPRAPAVLCLVERLEATDAALQHASLRQAACTLGLCRHERRSCASLRKKPLRSTAGGLVAKPAKDPSLAMASAAWAKPAQATRANAPPTLMRRTPSSARSATLRSLGQPTSTFTGFGA